jgi:hypothetical protein
VQEGQDELNGFLSPTVYLSRYIPKENCPHCDENDWGRVTTFQSSGAVWKGFIFCMSCNEKHEWEINPDMPIAWQAVRSSKPLREEDS